MLIRVFPRMRQSCNSLSLIYRSVNEYGIERNLLMTDVDAKGTHL